MPSSTRLLPVLVLAWGAACSCDEPPPRFLDASGGSAGDGGPAEVWRVLDASEGPHCGCACSTGPEKCAGRDVACAPGLTCCRCAFDCVQPIGCAELEPATWCCP